MSSITDYISDHFPLRETLLSFKTNVFKLIGVKRQNDIYYAEDYLIEEALNKVKKDVCSSAFPMKMCIFAARMAQNNYQY